MSFRFRIPQTDTQRERRQRERRQREKREREREGGDRDRSEGRCSGGSESMYACVAIVAPGVSASASAEGGREGGMWVPTKHRVVY